MKELNPEQLAAVKHREGPLLVLAGAGSGKTKVVTARCADLIESGENPAHILGLTFTNQAAGEMKERLAMQNLRPPLIATFHSFGARVLREFADYLGYSCNFVIYDEDDTLKVIKAVMSELGIAEKKGVAKELKALISSKKNQLDLAEDNLDEVFALYQSKMKQFQALDFDDLLYLTVRLLENHPEALEKIQRRWKWVMVDEYQDTNAAQYKILKLLVAKTGNLFVVGDPDQSIYSWRGANIQNILNFERDYPGAKVIRLEQNYRSHETILQAANALIEHNQSRYEKKLWSQLGTGPKIEMAELYSERDEARHIARKILDYNERGAAYDEIVIFYRTNAQSRPFEDQFISHGIPYRIIGGLSFYQRREVKDILAYLKVALSPADFVSLARTINVPKRGIGETTFEKLTQEAQAASQPLLDYIETRSPKVSKGAKEGLLNYLALINELKEAISADTPIGQMIKIVIEKSDYLNYLKEDPESYADRKENLGELMSKAFEFETTAESPTLAAFLEELSLKSSLDEGETQAKAVSLMTFHNGKGLEFEAVFMAGMEEGLFPHINSFDSESALEEERRLCYVGMTRAKKNLNLSGCTFRYIWGQERDCHPSRFLREIPGQYVARV